MPESDDPNGASKKLVSFVPHLFTAADIIERVYKLVKNIQVNRERSRNDDIAQLQDDVDALREAVELQTQLLQDRERELAELKAEIAELRRPWWRRF